MWSQQMKSTLEAHILWISHIKSNFPPPTRSLPNPPKKSKTLASLTTPIQTTGRASMIDTVPATSLSTATA